MELNPIQIILDDSGVMIDKYTIIPPINQYATNYRIDVAFLNTNTSARAIKAVFTINGKAAPAKILSPTLERIKLEEGVFSYYKHSLQLSQYETQFYQDFLPVDIYIYNADDTQLASTSIELPMVKQAFSKLTPANLEEDGTIKSVVDAIYDLEAAVVERVGVSTEDFETKENAEAKLIEAKNYTDQEVGDLKGTIQTNYATITYVDEKDAETLASANEYTDIAIGKLAVGSDTTLGLANQYTNTRIAVHNESSTAHEDIRGLINTKVSINELEERIENVMEGYASEAYVDNSINTAVTELIDNSPTALNTLKELSQALGDDPNFATTITNKIGEKVNQTEYDSKVANIESDIKNLSETKMNIKDLATVAKSGLYEDLKTKPVFVQNVSKTADNELIFSSNDGTVVNYNAGNISYSDLLDRPTFLQFARVDGDNLILTNNAGQTITFQTVSDYNDLDNLPTFIRSVSIVGNTMVLYGSDGQEYVFKALTSFNELVDVPVFLNTATIVGYKLKLFDNKGNEYDYEPPKDISYFNNDVGYITNENLVAYADNNLEIAKTYTNNKASETLLTAYNYTDRSIANLVDTSPDALNTLNELAAALGDDPNFSTTVMNEIGTKVAQTEYDAKIEEIDNNLSNNNTNISDLQSDVADFRTEYTSFTEATNASLAEQLEAIKQNETNISNNKSELQESINSLNTEVGNLATVAKTGSYEDLIDEPHVLSYFDNDIHAYTPETIVYSEVEPENPTENMIWLDPNLPVGLVKVKIRTWED